MKKIILFIALVICFVMSISNFYAVEAVTLYVKTESVKACDNYTKSIFNNMLQAQQNIQDYNNYYLGSGIKVLLPEENYIYYIYPVITHNKIVSTIHVASTDNGGYVATYTKSLAKELEELKRQTSKDLPLVLIRQGIFFYGEIGSKRILFDDHVDENITSKQYNSFETVPNITYSNLTTQNIYSNMTPNNFGSGISPRAPVKVLPWTVYETQGNNNWCASITTANIVRNNTGRYMTSAQMRNWLAMYDGLTNSQVADYLIQGQGMPNILQLASGKPTQSTIENEINSGRALWAGFERSGGAHAVAIMGYNNIAGVHYLHNPWYTYTETMTIGNVYLANGYKYKWTGGAVYNIK